MHPKYQSAIIQCLHDLLAATWHKPWVECGFDEFRGRKKYPKTAVKNNPWMTQTGVLEPILPIPNYSEGEIYQSHWSFIRGSYKASRAWRKSKVPETNGRPSTKLAERWPSINGSRALSNSDFIDWRECSKWDSYRSQRKYLTAVRSENRRIMKNWSNIDVRSTSQRLKLGMKIITRLTSGSDSSTYLKYYRINAFCYLERVVWLAVWIVYKQKMKRAQQ